MENALSLLGMLQAVTLISGFWDSNFQRKEVTKGNGDGGARSLKFNFQRAKEVKK